jgi:Fe-S cluster assembly protein SufD
MKEPAMLQIPPEMATNPVDSYLEAFERHMQPRVARLPSWLYPLRKAGLARFAELGFPTQRDEDWRFTNVTPIAQLPFQPASAAAPGRVTAEEVARFTFGRLAASRLVFVDGHYAPELSELRPLPKGMQVGRLAAALETEPELLEQHLGRLLRMDENSFGALNTAFFTDGLFLHVPDGIQVPDPVHVVFIGAASETGTASMPRNLMVVGAGAGVTLLETHVSVGEGRRLTNAVTEFVVGDGATVEHVKFQDDSLQAYHVSALHARLGRQANYVAHSFALGARLSRNNIRTELAGAGLECVLNGLYLTRGEQLADHHMVVEHSQPNGASHEYFNGILDDRSRGVFHGRILVQPIAQKTDAKQTNKNLLLSEEATANTKPQLEIYADDVKCTHGATIGQMNQEAIFYLRARGLSLATARRMLMHAFAGEIVDRVRHEPAREELDRLVWDRLEANPRVKVDGVAA